MPYITDDKRKLLDDEIAALAKKISDNIEASDIEGTMNYVITALLNKCMIDDAPRYKKINQVVGVLECVKQEFYRRLAAPYEDKAIAKNGDIACYDTR